MHRRDVAVHGIQALEDNELRTRRIGGLEQLLEVLKIVMAPDFLLAAGLADAFDHGIMIERVGQDQAVRQKFRDR